MSDFITVLQAHNRRLAKRYSADGAVQAYDDAKHFDMVEVEVGSLDKLATILARLLPRTDLCVVRGRIAAVERTHVVRRLLHADPRTGDQPTLVEADHHWIGLDVEGVARPEDVPAADLVACGALAIKLLPQEFHDARCIIQATAGHGIKPGCRLRLWFWGSRLVSGRELAFWMRRSPVDPCLFRPAQITYTAAPVFAGILDPIPSRMSVLDGRPYVEAPAPQELRPPASETSAGVARWRGGNCHADRIIARTLFRLRTAADGERHFRLRSAARTIGGLMQEAGLSQAEATRALLDAVMAAGGNAVDTRNATDTVEWGLRVGAASPLRLVESRG